MVPQPFGALIVASGLERDPARAQLVDDHLDAMIATAALLGAAPIVVAHDGTPRVNTPARAFRLPRAERDDLSAVRLGLMQLTNAPVGAALIMSIDTHAVDGLVLRSMVEEAQRRQVPLAAVARHGVLGFPLFATRDTWRDLLTSDAGLEGVTRALGPKVLAIEIE
jgi:hypothetical protein